MTNTRVYWDRDKPKTLRGRDRVKTKTGRYRVKTIQSQDQDQSRARPGQDQTTQNTQAVDVICNCVFELKVCTLKVVPVLMARQSSLFNMFFSFLEVH